MKLYYPVVFTREDLGFSTSAVDFDGCFSEGDTFSKAYANTQEAIGLFLDDFSFFPTASDPAEVSKSLKTNQFLCVVEFDNIAYKKRHLSKSVKKTLTIPQWLNDEAELQHINFSKTLQEALKNKLNIH